MDTMEEKKDISVKFGKRKIKYPTKTNINMMTCGLPKKTGKTVTIGLLLIALLVCFVVKTGVYDQFARLDRAQSQYDTVHAQNEALVEKVSGYSNVLMEYKAYSNTFVEQNGDGEEVVVMVDRKSILDLIESRMMTRGEVRSVNVTKNTAVVNMSGMNLEQISEMITSLKKNENVADVQLKIVQTEQDKKASILNFTVTIRLQAEEE